MKSAAPLKKNIIRLGSDIYNLIYELLARSFIVVNCWHMTKARVKLFTKPGCHLCEEAKEQILAAQCAGDYTLDEVNIESDPELFARYKNDIPVITINGVEAFRHRVTASEFRERVGAAVGTR